MLLVWQFIQKAIFFTLRVLVLSAVSVIILNLISLSWFCWWWNLLLHTHASTCMLKVKRRPIGSWNTASLLLSELDHILEVFDALFQNLRHILILIVVLLASLSFLISAIILIWVLCSLHALVIILHIYSLRLGQIHVMASSALVVATWLSSWWTCLLVSLAVLSVVRVLVGSWSWHFLRIT